MAQATATTRTRGRATKIVLGVVGAVFVTGMMALGVWTTGCPCDTTPGFMLLGREQRAPVKDWSFANDVQLCQIQISMYGVPHAVNLNCFATPDGELYLGCDHCAERKAWAKHVGPNEPARLRLNGRAYPVVLNRVTDPYFMDRAWQARVQKLPVYGGTRVNPKPKPDPPGPDAWWTFHVASATI